MFAAIGSYLKHIPQLAGVELLLADGEVVEANLAVVKRTGASVHFVSGEYGLGSYDAIKAHIPGGVPVVLAIGGKGIIHRILSEGRAATDADLLRQVLPNAKPDDFYVQQADLGSHVLLSVARRTLVDDIVGRFEGLGLAPLGIGLGPFAATLFGDYLIRTGSENLHIGRHRFTLRQGVFAGYDLLPPEAVFGGKRVDIAGEQLNERLVPAFAAAFAAISDISIAQLPIGSVDARSAEYRWRWMFRRTGIVLMAVFLLLLLVNALYFMHYSDKVAGFAGSDALALQREIDALERQSAERAALLDGLWPSAAPRWGMAYMADRIAATRPQGILFRELAVYPRDEALSRKQRRPVHMPSAIRIKGACTDMPVLNEWLRQVRGLPFCAAVEIEDYGFDGRSGEGTFTLSLMLEP